MSDEMLRLTFCLWGLPLAVALLLLLAVIYLRVR